MNYSSELSENRLEELVTKTAKLHLQNVAVVFADEKHFITLEYDELLEVATSIFKLLLKNFVSNQVVICISRATILTPCLILGILQAKCYFSFTDLRNISEFIKNMQKYIFVKFFLIEADTLEILIKQQKLNLNKIDDVSSQFGKIILLELSPNHENKIENLSYNQIESANHDKLAYAIQTSGTTGQPKMIFVPHRCIVPNILHLKSIFEICPEDNIIQLAPLTFDPSIIEIFLALISGSSIVIIPERIKAMPKNLSLILKKQNITIMQASPTIVNNFGINILKESILSDSSLLRILAFGGEECPSTGTIRKWRSLKNLTRFFNLYGITEVSCWATCYEILPQDLLGPDNVVPLGNCLSDTEIQLVDDKHLKILEEGEGELYIGGTRQCFINEEIKDVNLKKQMRSTGDCIYRTKNGALYFLERKDFIVKHNGKKINIKGIENIIRKLNFVNCCSIFYNKDEKILYIFVVPLEQEENIQVEIEITKILKSQQSMNVPFIVQIIHSLPQTTHGKLDYTTLINYSKHQKKMNKTDTFNICHELKNLWKKYTGIICFNDNSSHQFIYDGGDSIGAVQLSKEIELSIGYDHPLLVEKLLNCTLQDVLNYLIEFNSNLNDDICKVKRPFQINDTSDLKLIKKAKIINSSGKIQDLEDKNIPKENIKINNHNKSRLCLCIFSKRGNMLRCFCSMCSYTFSMLNRKYFDSINLKNIWNYDLEKCIDASPLVLKCARENITAFIGSHSGQFVAIDVKNGNKIWEIVLDGRIESSACVSYCGNYIAVGCYDFHIYCLERTTGKIYWKISTGAEVKCSPISDCFKNILYCGSHDKHLYSININTGIVLWKQKIGNGSIFSSPIINKEPYFIVAASLDGTISSINPKNGSIIWTYNCQKPIFSSPLNLKFGLCVGCVNGNIYFWNHQGKKIWIFNSKTPVFSSASYLHINEDTLDCKEFIVIGTDSGLVFCLNANNGTVLWRFQCNSSVYATPFVFTVHLNETTKYLVVVTSKLGTLYILDGLTGNELYKYILNGEIFSSPVVCDNFLIVGCRDNFIYCFNISYF